MCRFIETIRVENGSICNLAYHVRRMNETRRAFWGDVPALDLEAVIPAENTAGRMKCRVEYGSGIGPVTISPYRMRPVASLSLVEDDTLDYVFKYADRSGLDRLFERRGEADDILLVRGGLLTDTSIANLALFDGSRWVTPACPLLRGTKRQELLDKGVIREEAVPSSSLGRFTQIALFNALIDFGELVLPVTSHTIWQDF